MLLSRILLYTTFLAFSSVIYNIKTIFGGKIYFWNLIFLSFAYGAINFAEGVYDEWVKLCTCLYLELVSKVTNNPYSIMSDVENKWTCAGSGKILMLQNGFD